jgi:mxaJ protein
MMRSAGEPTMSWNDRETLLALMLLAVAVMLWMPAAQALPVDPPAVRELRVCADPNALPMSNQQRQGAENRIAALIAADLHAKLRYTWYQQRRSFLRKTLKAGLCDVVMGVPPGLQGVLTTRAYYTSAYVFVSRREAKLTGFDDPALRNLKIGLQTIGAEGFNPPPASSLALRGLTANVVGYPVWSDDSQPGPQRRIVEAVARGDVDTAIVWGPLAGHFAKHYGNQLVVTPVVADAQLPSLEFAYDIAVGVRSDAVGLRDELQGVLDRRRSDIQAILKAYGVPLVHSRATAAHGGATASLQ